MNSTKNHQFLDTIFGINYPLIIHLPSIETFTMPIKKNTKSKTNDKVVSAFVFDKEHDAPEAAGQQKNDTARPPITASVFVNEESDLTFKTKMRNIIQFTFESLRDNLIDLTPAAPLIRRSIEEMQSLAGEVDKRLSAEAAKRFHDLIGETSAFLQGDQNESTANADLQDVMHYRHYVRIAWFSHFILEDLKNLGR
jgi:hypothetical protein